MRTGTRNSLLVFPSYILYPDRPSITDYLRHDTLEKAAAWTPR